MPGFAWSTPVTPGDLNYWKIADILHRLMTDVLDHNRYGSLGSDYGALVNSALGHKYGDSVIALHYVHDLLPGILKLHAAYASHVAVHMLCASTFTHRQNDSPTERATGRHRLIGRADGGDLLIGQDRDDGVEPGID
ncbi:hypothetical protein [Streptomyces sp. NPDC101455]|uniref:hypothetical protein n=1 Tax=Streptomyces sp. NPDC101455 TaxID=3366142 RepID=UPI0037F6CCAC